MEKKANAFIHAFSYNWWGSQIRARNILLEALAILRVRKNEIAQSNRNTCVSIVDLSSKSNNGI